MNINVNDLFSGSKEEKKKEEKNREKKNDVDACKRL